MRDLRGHADGSENGTVKCKLFVRRDMHDGARKSEAHRPWLRFFLDLVNRAGMPDSVINPHVGKRERQGENAEAVRRRKYKADTVKSTPAVAGRREKEGETAMIPPERRRA